jgi:hypothetical protein
MHHFKEFCMSGAIRSTATDLQIGIDHSSAAPPVPIPRGHIGEFVIPGTGKRIWWTGRVAIGLRHQPVRCLEPVAQSSLWIQGLMLGRSKGLGASAS